MPQEPVPDVVDSDAGTRPALAHERIVATAVSFIDASGVPALTMRRLGAVMGVEAMSLYRYVVSREALLDAVVERLMAELDADPEVLTAPRDGWIDFVQRLAHGVRRIALAHPNGFRLVASRPTEAAWLSPPLRTLRRAEGFLSGLVAEGFSDRAAVASYRAFSAVLLGQLMLEVAPLTVDAPDRHGAGHGVAHGAGRSQPTLQRLVQEVAADPGPVEFDDALETLVDRIGRLRHTR